MDPRPKTTPKDFFLYLSGFVALYVSAISLLTLLFEIINKKFPDFLNQSYYYGYGDPYSGGLRFALASLIIVFPIYLAIASYLNRYLIANPEKRELWVRKWLSYLTLFITGVTVTIDVIVLINTFLGGEITTRFVLKVLAVLIVAGAVFAYYMYDMKKSFASDMKNRAKLIVSVAAAFVLLSLVYGFVTIGSPMKARAMRIDDRRLSDLQSIQWQVVNYWQQKEALPASLDALKDPISSFMVPKDPETGAEYKYSKTGALSFQLCATFALPSGDDNRDTAYEYSRIYPSGLSGDENWTHEAGEACFDRTIDPDLYPPYPKGVIR